MRVYLFADGLGDLEIKADVRKDLARTWKLAPGRRVRFSIPSESVRLYTTEGLGMTAGLAVGTMPQGKLVLDRNDWTVRILLLLVGGLFPGRARDSAVFDDSAQLPRCRRSIHRAGELLALLRNPGAVGVHLQQLLRRRHQHGHRHLARVRLRVCPYAHLHEIQGFLQDHGDGPAAESIAAQSHRTRVLVRQSRRAEQLAVRSFNLWSDRDRHGDRCSGPFRTRC